MEEIVFKEFPKLYRLNRDWYATEKIDGTNSCVVITDDGQIGAQSRNKLITVEQDNAGFARWVQDHKDELITGLGPGYHYGEWMGGKIQRGYGLKEKRFYLFNTTRWTDDVRPACCHVVPVLATGIKVNDVEKSAMFALNSEGSRAVPGWKNPEGIVLFHPSSGYGFKVTCFDDEKHKGEQA